MLLQINLTSTANNCTLLRFQILRTTEMITEDHVTFSKIPKLKRNSEPVPDCELACGGTSWQQKRKEKADNRHSKKDHENGTQT